MTVPRETITKVIPLPFRKEMREANAAGVKSTTRRVVSAKNSRVQPGTFEGLDLETGRARRLLFGELRAQCTFESGRVRVVTVQPVIRPGVVFWEKAGYLSRRSDSACTLHVWDVDVARVQDMTDADAIAEGVEFAVVPKRAPLSLTPRERFAFLWDSIAGRDTPQSWAANPWVWIYRYRVHKQAVDDFLASAP